MILRCRNCETEISKKEWDRFYGLCPVCFEYEEEENKNFKTDLDPDEWAAVLGKPKGGE